MEKETLVTMLQRQNTVLAEAISRMIDYIQDRWAAPYPSKEQTGNVRTPVFDNLPSESRPNAATNDSRAKGQEADSMATGAAALSSSLCSSETSNPPADRQDDDCHYPPSDMGGGGRSRDILNIIADILYKASEVFRRAIDAITHFGTEQHKSIFAPSEAADIKSVMQEYGETTGQQKAVGTWLCDYAESRQPFDEIKHRHTLNEVDDVAEGRYDWKIERERGGISM